MQGDGEMEQADYDAQCQAEADAEGQAMQEQQEEELLTEDEVRNVVTNEHRNADDCMEYLNGLEVDGKYKKSDVECYMHR
jgi:hypothetical protein